VSRTLERRRQGQDNVSVVSVTFDSASLDKLRKTQSAVRLRSRKIWLIGALLILALSLIALWYFSSR